MLFKLASFCLLGASLADLRFASQPRNANNKNNLAASYKIQQQGDAVKFVTTTNAGEALYMEPSAFNYQGLAAQRNNAYDNFLRSNIDNEQDKRNFNTEAGKDMLPFRSYEGAVTAAESGDTVQTKLPADKAIVAIPGTAFNVPLRWNNPHASELEVNIWILDNKVVVPIRKPACSGEGHKDNVFEFKIPADWASLSTKVAGFTGCNKVGDCVLQVYAHSVESRQYAQGTPLIVTATMQVATNAPAISTLKNPDPDPALDLSNLRDMCLPSNDALANIASAVPQKARLVSDVYNHAYQNSDFSPYSGQQAGSISKNMQASVILKMVSGNRGELGKSLLTAAQKTVQKQIEAQAKAVIVRLEGQTNNVINRLLAAQAKTQDTASMTNGQTSANCFLCAEKGAVNTRRLNTNTYVPSFQIPAALVAKARAIVDNKYADTLIDASGKLQIYTTALKLMEPAFVKAAASGLGYLGPRIKAATETKATLADATNFIKKDANGKKDQGQYATTQAYAKAPNENIGNKASIPSSSINWGTAGVVGTPTPGTTTPPPTPDRKAAFTSFGVNTVCRGDTSTDNQAAYYTQIAAVDLAACQDECLKATTCMAVEVGPGGRCELWKRVPGATAELTGYVCLSKKRAARRGDPTTFTEEANALAAGGTITPDMEQDSPSQMDPNGWGKDSVCDETQSGENPLLDKECTEVAPLFTGVDADGNLIYEGSPSNSVALGAAASLKASWLIVGSVVLGAVFFNV